MFHGVRADGQWQDVHHVRAEWSRIVGRGPRYQLPRPGRPLRPGQGAQRHALLRGVGVGSRDLQRAVQGFAGGDRRSQSGDFAHEEGWVQRPDGGDTNRHVEARRRRGDVRRRGEPSDGRDGYERTLLPVAQHRHRARGGRDQGHRHDHPRRLVPRGPGGQRAVVAVGSHGGAPEGGAAHQQIAERARRRGVLAADQVAARALSQQQAHVLTPRRPRAQW